MTDLWCHLRPYVFGSLVLLACLALCLILWLTINASWFFDGAKNVITRILISLADILLWIPWPVVILGVALATRKVLGRNMALFTAFSMLFVGLMGRLPSGTGTLWEGAMDTMALIMVSVTIFPLIGIPLGIAGAQSVFWDALMHPILGGMQTMPSFVDLVPGILIL